MKWNDHSKYVGRHAILSPSSYHWINYIQEDETYKEALFARYLAEHATEIGTIVHEYACKRIKYGMPLSKKDKNGLLFYLIDNGVPANVIDLDFFYECVLYYVNDAIGYGMDPEVVLYYSDNCYGTADSIIFNKNLLRIHDLKTGKTAAHIEQLEIYAALFCLEYGYKPKDISMELRIYQPENMITVVPDVADIVPIMDKIISSDKFLSKIQNEGLLR